MRRGNWFKTFVYTLILVLLFATVLYQDYKFKNEIMAINIELSDLHTQKEQLEDQIYQLGQEQAELSKMVKAQSVRENLKQTEIENKEVETEKKSKLEMSTSQKISMWATSVIIAAGAGLKSMVY